MQVLILSGGQLMADAARPLGQFIAGVAAVHLPGHTDQLAGLRAVSA